MTKVEVLYFEDCPNYAAAVQLVRQVAREVGVAVEIEEIEVRTLEDATRLRFLGSPSIRVDGLDVEPTARARTAYAFACRIYGQAGLPSWELVAAALTRATPQELGPGEPASGRWVGAAAVTAVLASMCCLGPVVLAAVGLSAAGISAAFEPLRPLFLGLTVILLGSAFYLTYRRQPVCAPGAACAVPDTRRTRRTRAALWLATVAVALAALFPVYGASLLQVGRQTDAAAGASANGTVRLRIAGMTCEACAVGLEKSLEEVPGVRTAAVSYADGEAVVATETASPPAPGALLRAVERAGYQASVASSE